MKVGDERINHGKLNARGNEYLCVAFGLTAARPRLKRTHCGGSHRNHPPATRTACGNCRLGGLWHSVPLGVHAVLAQRFGFDRCKRARTHVQRHAGRRHSLGLQALQHGFVKVQRSSRRSHGAGVASEHGLVAMLIFCVVAVVDVRRQRDATKLCHERIGVTTEAKPKQAAVVIWPAAQ